eukprot:s3915_g2.t1
MWQGTVLGSFDKFFTGTSIGARDVWNSQIVRSRPSSECQGVDLPVIPIKLRRARREPLDEDIRRQALLKLRDLLLQDPLATQLGTSLKGHVEHGVVHDDVDQSFRDCFRMKASSTLQKRASSLWKLAKCLRAEGQLNPLRLSEPQLYGALCSMRAAGAGATSAQHSMEALHFLDSTAKLTIVSISDVVSARCRGVARDMYLSKNPLQQKLPLTVGQVRQLESIMFSVGTAFAWTSPGSSMKSVLRYSRENFTSLYSKVLQMFRLIRTGDFCPDLPAIDRIVEMADGADEAQPSEPAGADDAAEISDSESSLASLESVHDDTQMDGELGEVCVSLFPSFSGVPEPALMVHRISALVHVVSEDDFLLCGRPTSIHFRPYARVTERDHLASCRQCLRAFQNRKSEL